RGSDGHWPAAAANGGGAAEVLVLARRGADVAGRTPAGPRASRTRARRGALVALAAVAVGVLLVWGLYRTVRWFLPAGQELTIAKPKNGTIFGPGIECGTTGDKCTTRIPT